MVRKPATCEVQHTGGRLLGRVLMFVLLGLVFFAGHAIAQPYVSRLGFFQVDQIKGCAPFTVTITNVNLKTTAECTGTKPCNMNFDGTNPQQNVFVNTYTTPGTYKLTLLYQSQASGPDDITITVLPNLQPTFDLYTCSNNQVTVNVTDKNYDQYYINFGDGSPVIGIPFSNSQTASRSYAASGTYPISVHGKDVNAADNCSALTQSFQALAVLPAGKLDKLTAKTDTLIADFTAAPHLDLRLEIAVNSSATFQTYAKVYGLTTLTLPAMAPGNNYYCLRLNSYDPCTGINTYSNVVCSQIFTVTPQNNEVDLTWATPPAGITNYSLNRNGNALLVTPAQNFIDKDVHCKQSYCYTVTSQYTNGATSTSMTVCATAFRNDVPVLINNATSVVNDAGSSVELTWQQDPSFIASQYTVLRGSEPSLPQFLTFVPSTTYKDDKYTTDGNFCYRINYTDECNSLSAPGEVFCPLRLTGTLDKKNVITVEWNNYTGWKSGVKNYKLEKYNQGNGLLKTYDMGSQTTFVDNEPDALNQILSYRVIAEPNDPLESSVSNIAKFVKAVNLWYPDAFTPNGDNKNDDFLVRGHFIETMQVNIFDRWGTLIYSTDNYEPWDGYFQGKLMPESTYVWTAHLTDLTGQKQVHHGTLVLLHKKR